LGEVTVIFTAAIGVMALIGRRREKKKKPEPKKKKAPSKNTKKAEA
jgi:hypothetical protein